MFTATPVVRIFLAKSQGHFRVLGQVTSIDKQHQGSLTFYQTNSHQAVQQVNLAGAPTELGLPATLVTSHSKIWDDWHEVLKDLMKAIGAHEQLCILEGPAQGCHNWELIPVDTFQDEPRLGCSTNLPCAA